MAEVTVSLTEFVELAGLKVEALASPTSLLSAGSESTVDTGLTGLFRV